MGSFRRLGVVVLFIALVAGCGGSPRKEPAVDYTPVPDSEIFAQVSALPGVESHDLEYTDTFANPNVYGGTVQVEAGSDPLKVLDAVLALLRTGRHRAQLAIRANSEEQKMQFGPDSLDLFTRADYDERYGPQPGDGTPPATLP